MANVGGVSGDTMSGERWEVLEGFAVGEGTPTQSPGRSLELYARPEPTHGNTPLLEVGS